MYRITKQFEIENTDQLLTLMEIYLSAWQHRDNLFFKEIITYFFSALVVMILPFADIRGLHLPKALPTWLFPGIGMVMAIAFFIISSGYIARFKALNDPYIESISSYIRSRNAADENRILIHSLYGDNIQCGKMYY